VKGLEVVFILSAAVIKDIYFNANREMFNIGTPNITTTKRKNSGPVIAGKPSPPPIVTGGFTSGPPPRQNVPASQIPPQQSFRPSQSQQSIPPTNARSQWEIDAETARLKAQVEAEEKERDRQVREEQKRIKKMLEQEEKEEKKRAAEVAKETERLRKQYGVTGQDTGPQFAVKPPMPPRPQIQQRPGAFPQHYSAPHSQPAPVPRPQSTSGAGFTYDPNTNTWGVPGRPTPAGPSQGNSPYLQAPGTGTASSSGFFGLGKKVQKKRSVFF
jgi:DNA polymerase III gamma/tau subunit